MVALLCMPFHWALLDQLRVTSLQCLLLPSDVSPIIQEDILDKIPWSNDNFCLVHCCCDKIHCCLPIAAFQVLSSDQTPEQT